MADNAYALVQVDPRRADVAQLMVDYRDHLIAAGVLGEAAAAAFLHLDLAEFEPPSGTMLGVITDAELVGVGAVRLLEPGVAEMKRVYLSPRVRGRGLGMALVVALEAAARTLGATTMRLDTADGLDAAIAMYESAGYRQRDAYNANPDCTRWYTKEL